MLPDIEKKKSSIRSYLKVLIKRKKIFIAKDKCAICGSTERIEFHHPDILNEPFFVTPLCKKCHTKMHHPL
jgi:hypothetical protein